MAEQQYENNNSIASIENLGVIQTMETATTGLGILPTTLAKIEIDTQPTTPAKLSSPNSTPISTPNCVDDDYESDKETICSFYSATSTPSPKEENTNITDYSDIETLVSPDSPYNQNHTFSDTDTDSVYEPSIFSPKLDCSERDSSWGSVFNAPPPTYDHYPSLFLDGEITSKTYSEVPNHEHEVEVEVEVEVESVPEQEPVPQITNTGTDTLPQPQIPKDIKPCLQCAVLGLRCSFSVILYCRTQPKRSTTCCGRCRRSGECCIRTNEAEWGELKAEKCYSEGLSKEKGVERAGKLIERKKAGMRFALPAATEVRRRVPLKLWQVGADVVEMAK